MMEQLVERKTKSSKGDLFFGQEPLQVAAANLPKRREAKVYFKWTRFTFFF